MDAIVAVQAQAASSPARFHPGFAGGGIFDGGKLCCIRTTCPKSWRSACKGLKTADCRKKHCTTVLAPDGAVCDVSPCVQGLCWLGVCMGGGLPTCPSHQEECMQYKCNPKTGQCRESCPKPNGTPCKGGTCQCGKCKPDPHTCPPNPDRCSIYVFNNATAQCGLVNATCALPPDACKQLSCNPRTGLCTVVTNKPDNTTCPGGTCQGGQCKPEPVCPATCPTHPNACKAFACNAITGRCSIVVDKCPAVCPAHPNACKERECDLATGRCSIVVDKCPPVCPAHPNACKERKCNLATGRCSIVVDKPDNTTCPDGTCQAGSCRPPRCPSPCPSNPNSCKAFACNTTTAQCSIVVNKPNNSSCPGGTCQGGNCQPTCPTCPTNPDACKLFACNVTTAQCTTVENRPDGTLCPIGQCLNGVCMPDLICPPNPDPCQRYQLTPNGTACTLVTDPDGTLCSDRHRCTTNDTCQAGKCTGTPVTCPARAREFQQCVQSVRDEATGGCVDVQAPDGTNCTDGSLCTTGDACVAGQCRGTPVVCNLHANPCKSVVQHQ
ncbi:hypothetical protein COO60DRAFT_1647526 [Scenedesmus sp. NREL 46B-D3]|nr:hypothetical protein COO60DRAFT_1647526 [Scenedesmus sp. NREL 46B-D3]